MDRRPVVEASRVPSTSPANRSGADGCEQRESAAAKAAEADSGRIQANQGTKGPKRDPESIVRGLSEAELELGYRCSRGSTITLGALCAVAIAAVFGVWPWGC